MIVVDMPMPKNCEDCPMSYWIWSGEYEGLMMCNALEFRERRKLRELAEIERRTFGTPVFEHKGDVRLPSIDDEGEWDVMAMPKILGDDHRVDEEVVDALQDQLLESMVINETKGGTE